jgi:S-adenosylmethionine:tRNA ribosyltransferase-isomerase
VSVAVRAVVTKAADDVLQFELPATLVAHEPPEARGFERDGVRLLVSEPGDAHVRHATMRDLAGFLRAGDLLVVNTSRTISAALDAWRPGAGGAPDEMIGLHLSSPVPYAHDDHRWIVELRRLTATGSAPLLDAGAGERIHLRGGASAKLVASFGTRRERTRPSDQIRLWIAELTCPGTVLDYAAEFGSPIRYGYVPHRWPLSAYQTVFADEPGSAEMPSAGRPFSTELMDRLDAAGVEIARLVLHTGVASLESGEAPYPERYRVPRETADAVNRTKARDGRVVAVGTTVVRALESVVGDGGIVSAGEGWTELVVTPQRRVQVVDGLITGFHEPRASHLAILDAVGGRRQLETAYAAALEQRYLWHEFGDSHLLWANS